MSTPDTGAQPTGPLTIDQGVAQLKAKMAERKETSDSQVAQQLDDNGFPIDETEQVESTEAQTDEQETTEQVSADETQEAETEEPDNRPIILPDGAEITVEEARKGYLRQSDYSRKTNALAQERDHLIGSVNAKVKDLDGLIQQVASLQEQEPNWLQLAQDPNTDPKQLQAAQAYWQHKKQVTTRAQTELAQARERETRAAKAKAYQVLNSGEYDKTWTDPKALGEGLDRVAGYMVEKYGYDDRYIASITDPHIIVAFDKARKLDELESKKPKAQLVVKGKPKPFTPGAKSTEAPQAAQLKSLQEKYRNNPSVENAVALERFKANSNRGKPRLQ